MVSNERLQNRHAAIFFRFGCPFVATPADSSWGHRITPGTRTRHTAPASAVTASYPVGTLKVKELQAAWDAWNKEQKDPLRIPPPKKK